MTRTLIILFAATCTTPALACNPGLFERVDQPVRDTADISFDVAEIQSTEGGEWKVWRDADGDTNEVARIDYGEMGRLETRMVVESTDAYAVLATRYGYAAPIYVEGAMTVRVETDIYMFCDGELLTPPEDFGLNEDYAKAAERARATFDAPEILEYLPAR
ncbi:hypothetical protein SAMN06295905_1974 [Devosia lucknowensis]|uniref:Lipoprotein n=1 Tax=Devosia lucknowensis TaxID=1096929 RepID=A0A1Y6FAN7_9HYPH|nr:hypothetical protein [Devosia lucknowensis]SMQ71988.1 hypothetical protein SAMN06295905_1974 [Devosia lucknowensis]